MRSSSSQPPSSLVLNPPPSLETFPPRLFLKVVIHNVRYSCKVLEMEIDHKETRPFDCSGQEWASVRLRSAKAQRCCDCSFCEPHPDMIDRVQVNTFSRPLPLQGARWTPGGSLTMPFHQVSSKFPAKSHLILILPCHERETRRNGNLDTATRNSSSYLLPYPFLRNSLIKR